MAQRRFQYDSDDVPSLDVRIQAQGGPHAAPLPAEGLNFTGTVNSGASTTVLSMKNAKQLGLTPADLRKAPDAVIADRRKVHCWSTDTPIRAQVLRRRSPSDELLPWGPVFALHVLFMEDADPLWGQADFFATFGINFERPDLTLRY